MASNGDRPPTIVVGEKGNDRVSERVETEANNSSTPAKPTFYLGVTGESFLSMDGLDEGDTTAVSEGENFRNSQSSSKIKPRGIEKGKEAEKDLLKVAVEHSSSKRRMSLLLSNRANSVNKSPSHSGVSDLADVSSVADDERESSPTSDNSRLRHRQRRRSSIRSLISSHGSQRSLRDVGTASAEEDGNFVRSGGSSPNEDEGGLTVVEVEMREKAKPRERSRDPERRHSTPFSFSQRNNIFIELEVLKPNVEDSGYEWREAARWIKYEEDVEESGDKWSKAHVPTLEFHSVVGLYDGFKQALFCLDCKLDLITDIADMLVDKWMDMGVLDKKYSLNVIATLLTPHRHQGQSQKHHLQRSITVLDLEKDITEQNITDYTPQIHRSYPDLENVDEVSRIMKVLESDAEATVVMVGQLQCLEHSLWAFVRFESGVNIPHLVEVPIPVKFIFIYIDNGDDQDRDIFEIGRTMATFMADTEFHTKSRLASCVDEMLDNMDFFLDTSLVLPKGKQRGLSVTDNIVTPFSTSTGDHYAGEENWRGRLFKGLLEDIRFKSFHYREEWVSGLTWQTFASIPMVFVTILAAAVIWGEILTERTGGNFGIVEMLMIQSIGGILYSITAGQPLVILAGTAPVVLFIEALYSFCEDNSVDFYAFWWWTSMWCMFFCFVLVACQGFNTRRLFTQFTEEIFGVNVALIFIYEAFLELKHIYDDYPVSSPQDANVALFSTLLMAFTFVIATSLETLRMSAFFNSQVRHFISDISPMVALFVTIIVDKTVTGIYTPKLKFESVIDWSKDRNWIVDPKGENSSIDAWVPFAAIIPGFLGIVLIYVEQTIASLWVNKKSHKLQRGCGYNLDLAVVGVCLGISGMLGLPWIVAAHIRTNTHVRELSYFTTKNAPGQKPVFLGVREQRITATLSHILLGIAMLVLKPVIKEIPFGTLLGILLFFGVNSLYNIGLIERIGLLFTSEKYFPDRPYVHKVRTWRMYLYTLIQVSLVAMLAAIELSPAGFAFALGVLSLIPIRAMLQHFNVFTYKELESLDGEI
eukprot:Nk52_evm25s352 gene=Nk52_evmTU25s352